MIEKIVSGGQTGADRGGLEAALFLGISHGGWCPSGRRAEDGRIPARYYGLVECASDDYAVRTIKNIDHSDGTIVFTDALTHDEPGSALTVRETISARKPCLRVATSDPLAARKVKHWLKRHMIKTLNVAGHRESKARGIEKDVRDILVKALAR